jgi:polygalacturonase
LSFPLLPYPHRTTSSSSPPQDCAAWGKLENVVLEGPGTVDGDGAKWLASDQESLRPVLLDLLWIDGLTLKDLSLRRPAFWTAMPAFCNNVRVTGMDIVTAGGNTDGLDPDSTWNVYVSGNLIDSGDDCVAIKAGRDWSGRMVNISTRNVLIEANDFRAGHGVSIGSETSGWIQDVVIRDSNMSGTDRCVLSVVLTLSSFMSCMLIYRHAPSFIFFLSNHSILS